VKVIGEQMNNAEPMPVIKEWEEIAQNVLTTFEKIYRGKADVQKELDSFNAKSEQILTK
jgi:multiple sugar transport system substrate-binding protein